MAVGILLMTPPGLGAALINAAGARRKLPLACASFEVPTGADIDTLLPAASAALRKVDGGKGVLLLSDMQGSTASALAARLAHLGTPTRRVSGLSLPMLMRVLDYPEQPLEEMPATAAAGARNGAILDGDG